MVTMGREARNRRSRRKKEEGGGEEEEKKKKERKERGKRAAERMADNAEMQDGETGA